MSCLGLVISNGLENAFSDHVYLKEAIDNF